jgi:hypothetical protein
LSWRNIVSRAGRSSVQVLIPTLILLASTRDFTTFSGWALLDLIGSAAVITVGKALFNMQADPKAPWYVQAIERAIPAAASALLGYTTAAGFSLLNTDWRTVGYATALAFLTALAHTVIDPPPAFPDPTPALEPVEDDESGGEVA